MNGQKGFWVQDRYIGSKNGILYVTRRIEKLQNRAATTSARADPNLQLCSVLYIYIYYIIIYIYIYIYTVYSSILAGARAVPLLKEANELSESTLMPRMVAPSTSCVLTSCAEVKEGVGREWVTEWVGGVSLAESWLPD